MGFTETTNLLFWYNVCIRKRFTYFYFYSGFCYKSYIITMFCYRKFFYLYKTKIIFHGRTRIIRLKRFGNWNSSEYDIRASTRQFLYNIDNFVEGSNFKRLDRWAIVVKGWAFKWLRRSTCKVQLGILAYMEAQPR